MLDLTVGLRSKGALLGRRGSGTGQRLVLLRAGEEGRRSCPRKWRSECVDQYIQACLSLLCKGCTGAARGLMMGAGVKASVRAAPAAVIHEISRAYALPAGVTPPTTVERAIVMGQDR